MAPNLFNQLPRINAWDNPDFVAAVKATGRNTLIIAGTITSVCMAFPCIYAVLIESYSTAQEVVTQHEQLDSVLA